MTYMIYIAEFESQHLCEKLDLFDELTFYLSVIYCIKVCELFSQFSIFSNRVASGHSVTPEYTINTISLLKCLKMKFTKSHEILKLCHCQQEYSFIEFADVSHLIPLPQSQKGLEWKVR